MAIKENISMSSHPLIKDANVVILLCFQVLYPHCRYYIFFLIYRNILFWYNTDIGFSFLNSMNDIIDKYSTHSKNLGKAHQQPSIDLNVC